VRTGKITKKNQALLEKNKQNIEEYFAALKEYCRIVEKTKKALKPDLGKFLKEILKPLSLIYSKSLLLPKVTHVDVPHSEYEKDEVIFKRFWEVLEFYQNLCGKYNLYWHIFNPYELPEDEPFKSPLGNDIAELYEAYLGYLKDYKEAKDEIKLNNLIWTIRLDFFTHAGPSHILPALRAIHSLLYDFDKEVAGDIL
jgi:hypothetical protein